MIRGEVGWPVAWVTETVQVLGQDMSVRLGGRRDRETLLLVHGNGGHSGWWVEVAPLLAQHYRVLVPDLTGHGDSAHKSAYSPESWADELAELVSLTGADKVSVIGHSMGGRVSLVLAERSPALVERLVLVDSAIRPPSDPERRSGRPRRPARIFASRSAAEEAFHLQPPHTCAAPEVMSFVASASVRAVSGGWTWKFDPQTGQQFTDERTHRALARARCPVGLISGELSSLDSDVVGAHLQRVLGREVPQITVDGAYHHIPLDRPRECARAIHTLIDELGGAK